MSDEPIVLDEVASAKLDEIMANPSGELPDPPLPLDDVTAIKEVIAGIRNLWHGHADNLDMDTPEDERLKIELSVLMDQFLDLGEERITSLGQHVQNLESDLRFTNNAAVDYMEAMEADLAAAKAKFRPPIPPENLPNVTYWKCLDCDAILHVKDLEAHSTMHAQANEVGQDG